MWANVDLVIARSEGVMSIDNQPLGIDTSPLPINVAIVAYDCSGGAGNIEYSDRLRLLEPFIDVTPYAPFVNAWLSAATLITGAPLTLALAQQIKLALVDGLFNSKRQLPITALGRTWDASDHALMGMQAAITSWDVAAAATSADSSLTTNFNGIGIDTRQTQPAATSPPSGSGGGAISYVPGYSQNQNGTYHNADNVNSDAYFGAVSGGGFSQQALFSAQYHAPLNASPVVGPSIDWPPYNSTTTIRLAMTDMRTLMSTINARRTTLQNTRISKTSVINNMTTIAAVIAYDATLGWPY
jgi:hypothetical protein